MHDKTQNDTQPQKNWQTYFASQLNNKHRPRTELAVKANQSLSSVAVDCGCGVGADTSYLLDVDYTVHAFDNNQDAIELCLQRFQDNDKVTITTASFAEFSYPPCGIFMANASLFFAHNDFVETTWQRIVDSIVTGGVFVGDFLGHKDDWLNKPPSNFDHQLLAFTHEQVLALFTDFTVLKVIERDEQGSTAINGNKHWHSFAVIARKM